MLLNLITDPFGVFGDRLLGWWSYNETRNVQVAKFSYLEQHHEEFDSYVVGGPSAGAWDTQALNAVFNAKFYNLALNTQDMRDAEQYVRWLIGHYEVKNLVLNVTVDSAKAHAGDGRDVTEAMPCQLDGSSSIAYYVRYLFANPRYGLSKLRRIGADSIVPNSLTCLMPAPEPSTTPPGMWRPSARAAWRIIWRAIPRSPICLRPRRCWGSGSVSPAWPRSGTCVR